MLRTFPFISPIIFTLVVLVLGLVTPGYSHLNHTISRLAIEKYGWLQSLNFIQLAIALYLTGNHLALHIKDETVDEIIRGIFRFSSAFLIIAAFVPTDPIENVPLDYTILTPTGLVHISLVAIFLLLSPIGIVRLSQILKKTPGTARYTRYTLVAGFSAFFGSVVWFAFYFMGIFLEYRGIFQKAIALPVLIWLILINYTMMRHYHRAEQ